MEEGKLKRWRLDEIEKKIKMIRKREDVEKRKRMGDWMERNFGEERKLDRRRKLRLMEKVEKIEKNMILENMGKMLG